MTSPAAEPRRDWKAVEAILDAALEAPADQRDALLDRECGGDRGLRREVEDLIRACEEDHGFLEMPAGAFASSLVSEEIAAEEKLPEGMTIGPYRLIREIARGGMGSVYLGERADGQFEQSVALKLIKRGMDSDEVNRRFLAERRILARLSHDHIARLVDGGMTKDDHPWFAMEFVDGVPITRYCNGHNYTTDQRVELFQSVCEAVRYAHQNLVIHRDLKPSNILVTPNGQVKLLDFGIAKLLEENTSDTPLTQTEVRVMTPEYAAPEQVRGDPVTTATDVYALGAVLYELVSGRRAHQFKRRVPAEIERVVTEVEPEPPSVAAMQEKNAAAARSISGDLDTIVLKALQKDPARRYLSADAFGEDLKKYRAGLPVSARPDTIRYRVRKFVRRYRVLVAATTVVVVSLAAGLAGTVWQSRAASRQAHLASAEASRANEVKEFLVGIFKGSDPTVAQRSDVTARDLLESGTRGIDTALKDQPEIQAELFDVLGVIHSQLALYPRADTLINRSIQISRSLPATSDSLLAERLDHRAINLSGWSKYPQADSVFRDVLAIRRKTLGPNHPLVASTLAQIGEMHRLRGNFDSAELVLREAVAMHRRRGQKNDLELAAGLYNLGITLNENAKNDAADSANREALAIRRARLSPDHPDVLNSMHQVALNILDSDPETSIKMENEVLAKRRRLYGENHYLIADALNVLSLTLQSQGKLAEAESLQTHALEINRKTLGDDHNSTIVMANNLAVLRYRLRQLPGAVAAMRIARDAWIRTLGPDHGYAVTAANNLGAMLSDLGEYKEAEPLIRSSLAARIKRFGDESPEPAQSMRNLGLLLHRTGRLREGEAILRHALTNYRKAYGTDNFRTAEGLTALGALLTDAGKPQEGEQLLREALAVRTKLFQPTDTKIAETQGALGENLTLRGRYAEAETLLLASLRSYTADGRDAPAIGRARRRLATLYERRGNPTEAAKYR